MKIYFAPMESITDALFRQAYAACFGGVDKYFMPFVSPSLSFSYTAREEFDFSPRQNKGIFAVPQILARDAECFIGAAKGFADLGYTEVNLNLGCPVGTVTGKGKGSAMLRDRDALRRFLDAVFASSPLPVSIKSRIGFDSPSEWEKLLPVFGAYPIHEFILHPRTRQQLYRGTPYREAFGEAMKALRCPLIYNGDLFTPGDAREISQMFPGLHGVMLGRGLLTNPALLREMRGGAPLKLEDVIHFHDYLFRAYERAWHPLTAVGRMHVFLKYFAHGLDVPVRFVRDALRANKLEEYQDAVSALFAQAKLKESPRYIQPEG